MGSSIGVGLPAFNAPSQDPNADPDQAMKRRRAALMMSQAARKGRADFFGRRPAQSPMGMPGDGTGGAGTKTKLGE